MIPIVTKYLKDQAKVEEKRHITFSKTDDNVFVFVKDVFDQETGELTLEKEVIATIKKKEINDEIDAINVYLGKLQEFLTVIKDI